MTTGYQVTDPKQTYPIWRVDLVADNPARAIAVAIEAMMHARIDQVDTAVVREIIADLTIDELLQPDLQLTKGMRDHLRAVGLGGEHYETLETPTADEVLTGL